MAKMTRRGFLGALAALPITARTLAHVKPELEPVPASAKPKSECVILTSTPKDGTVNVYRAKNDDAVAVRISWHQAKPLGANWAIETHPCKASELQVGEYALLVNGAVERMPLFNASHPLSERS